MFGGILWKGIVFGMAVMLVLTVGTELLASVVSVVVSARRGDLIPIVTVFLGTLFISLILRRLKKHSPTKLLLSILVYGTIGYAAVVSFIAVLPWGLLPSLMSASMTILGFSVAATPTRFGAYRSQTKLRSLALRTDNPSGRITSSAIAALSDALTEQARVVIIQEGDRDKVVQLMKERPLLPVSITRLADCYAVVVTSPNSDEVVFRRAIDTLSEFGISRVKRARHLLAEAILMLPLIDESYGFSMREYRVVRDDTTMTHVISQWPERLTIFATKEGLGALVPERAATGLKTEQLPRGLETDVVLFRNYSLLQGDDESGSQAA